MVRRQAIVQSADGKGSMKAVRTRIYQVPGTAVTTINRVRGITIYRGSEESAEL